MSAQLSQLVSMTIQSTADQYASLNRAYRALPREKRATVARPVMLKSESIKSQLPAFLLSDSRQYELSTLIERNDLLRPKYDLFPAEGSIYLTNYRDCGLNLSPLFYQKQFFFLIPTKSVIFHGVSVEYVEKSLFRSIPVKSITKLKTMTHVTPSSPVSHSPVHHQIRGSSGEFLHFCLAAEVRFVQLNTV